MFKSKSKGDSTSSAPSINTNSLTSTGVTCMIAKGTLVEGKFTSSEDAQINGTLKGEIVCKKRLLMGSTGWIEGTVHTQSAIVKGHIKGALIVQGVLHLHSTAKVEGTILAGALQVEEGAQYNGECKIGERFVKEEQPRKAVA